MIYKKYFTRWSIFTATFTYRVSVQWMLFLANDIGWRYPVLVLCLNSFTNEWLQSQHDVSWWVSFMLHRRRRLGWRYCTFFRALLCTMYQYFIGKCWIPTKTLKKTLKSSKLSPNSLIGGATFMVLMAISFWHPLSRSHCFQGIGKVHVAFPWTV